MRKWQRDAARVRTPSPERRLALEWLFVWSWKGPAIDSKFDGGVHVDADRVRVKCEGDVYRNAVIQTRESAVVYLASRINERDPYSDQNTASHDTATPQGPLDSESTVAGSPSSGTRETVLPSMSVT